MKFPKFKINLDGHKKYYLAYSACFLITALLFFSWYILAHRTLIWREDGWQQHYKALIYYSGYLRSIIKGILYEHKLIIPNWDFSIGQGADILGTLHYYTIGDPFSIFSVFFSADSMYLYYDAAIILRIYFAGIAFSALCFHAGHKNGYGVLAGSMTYVFCEWVLFAMRHPYFLNPMLFFPLLILGIEKIIKGKRPYLFITAVAISAISNFYFFYMMVLAVVIYVVVRFIILYRKNIKEGALMLVRIGASSVLGVILAAVTFLPMCYIFLNDSRVSNHFRLHLFYSAEYYSRLPRLFIASGHMFSGCMGFSVPVLLAVFLMYYKRKEYKLTKWLFALCITFVMIPAFGQIFNGFTYISNRWIWVFALLSSYILVQMWPSLMNLNAKEGTFIFKCSVIYFIVCILCEYSHTVNVFASIAIAFISLFLLIPMTDGGILPGNKKKQQFLLLIVLISVILNSYWEHSFFEGNEATIYMETRQLVLNDNETAAVAEAAASDGVDGFYRYSGRNLTENANMIAKISSTQYYWSLINPNIVRYRNALEILENRSFDPSNYDDRPGLNSLASVLYYSVPQGDSNPVPYGFSPIDSAGEQLPYKLYRNDYALPLAYTYDSYMSEDSWYRLSSVDKEEAMLQSVVLSDNAIYTPQKEPDLNSFELPYEITCSGNEITMSGNSFVTTAEDSSAVITFDGPQKGRILLLIDNLQFKETPRYDLYYGDSSLDPLDLYNEAKLNDFDYVAQQRIKRDKFYWSELEHPKTAITLKSSDNEAKVLQFFTENYSFYSGRHDFTANFTSSENGITSIDLSFNLRGVYTFDSIKVICQPMDNYVNQIESLKENTLENITIGTDTVTGQITLDKPGLLCFSIPYSIGWSAYVDGEKTKLHQANIMHMALDLDAGTHDIRLEYRTPLLKAGIYISLLGLAIFAILIAVYEKSGKNKSK